MFLLVILFYLFGSYCMFNLELVNSSDRKEEKLMLLP